MSTRVADVYAAQKAFVGDVSHEIRTPLTSIRGFAEALLDGTVTDPDQQRRALGVIRDEAVRIGEVSQTLLALSELEAGAVQVARVPVDLSVLADALRGRFSGAASEAQVCFEVDLPVAERPLRRSRSAAAGGLGARGQRHRLHAAGRRGARERERLGGSVEAARGRLGPRHPRREARRGLRPVLSTGRCR